MILEGLLLIIALVLFHEWYSRPRGLPPGPTKIAFIGSRMPLFLKQVKEYQKKYGDIFWTEIGALKMVYLCNFKLIKEALNKMEVADRPSTEGFHFLTGGKEMGIVFSNGQRWQNSRRFLLRNLRDLGMGKSTLDEAIVHEARFLIEEFKKCEGKPQPIPRALNIAVLNIIWQMVASRRYDLHDEEITNFIKLIKELQANFESFVTQDAFPAVKMILPHFIRRKLFSQGLMDKIVEDAQDIFGKIIDSRRATLDPANAENVIDEYLLQIEQKTDEAQFFSHMDLVRSVFDLFGAGFDTTSNTLRWVLLYAATYPEVQKRVQKQIDEVLSRDEFPTSQHKNQLPLVEAFFHEVLRHSSLLPLGVFRLTNSDIHLSGYHIPKGTMLFSGTGICHKSPKYWEEPQEFLIERFLDEEGRFKLHKEGFAPFGLGKRSCLGESLAKMELSIFTAAFLQNFTFSPPKGRQVDLTPDDIPFQHFPREQDILITVRK